MLKKSIFVAILASTMFFQGCDDKSNEVNSSLNETTLSNEFLLTSTDTKQLIVKKEPEGFTLQGAQGKVILFDIFATWCPPCRTSASHLTSLQEKYKDDLVIIGLTIEDEITNAELVDFKNTYDAKYTITNSSVNRLLINEIASALELGERFPIPLMALYYNGKLVTHYVGEVQEEFIESDIKRALGK